MKQITTVIAVIAAFVLMGSGAWPFPNSGSTNSGTSESITFGNSPYEYSALIYIAEDQGYFSENGLNVIIRNYTSSLVAINGLAKNETNFSVSSEYAMVQKAFEKENIRIIASIDKYQTIYLYGRKDRGIESVTDLRGKKVGLTRGGIAEFYLGRFLDLHGMSIQDVTLVNLQPPEYVDALANGSVDLMVAGYPSIDKCKERLGSNLILWPAQSEQSAYFVMACRNDWIASHPKIIIKLLKSLTQAEEYAINHPAQAKEIVQKRLNHSDSFMETIWPEHQFSLTLDQSLILAMSDEGRWMINNNLTTEKTLPYFRDYIYTKGLEEVKPEAVNIR